MQYKQDDIKYKLTDLKQRDSWWQMGFSPALPIARKKITGLFRRLFGILFKFIVYLFNYFSRNPSRNSAKNWLSCTATCAELFKVLCNVQ